MNFKKSIKGRHLIIFGIMVLILSKFLYYIFPNDITILSISMAMDALSLILIVVGILTAIRNRFTRNNDINILDKKNIDEDIKQESKVPKNKLNNGKIIITLVAVAIIIFILAIAYYFFRFIIEKKNLELGKKQEETIIDDHSYENEFFEKKMICKEYGDEIKKEIDTEREKYSNLGNPPISSPHFIFIFYSPKKNTCLYVINDRIGKLGKGWTIYDAMTKEQVANFNHRQCEKNCLDVVNEYKNFILEYSGGEIDCFLENSHC